ncbi:MAG: hypothetical protein ACTMHX_04650 [Bifidobacterium mongoliense]|jgi:hypothetical protein
MSIHQLSDEQLNLMIHALRAYTPDGTLWLTRTPPTPPLTLTLDAPTTLSRIGQILREENTRAVNQHHGGSDLRFYDYHEPRDTSYTPIEVIKAAIAYQTQASASKQWDRSDAKEIVEQLLYAAIRRLDGWTQAPWERA